MHAVKKVAMKGFVFVYFLMGILCNSPKSGQWSEKHFVVKGPENLVLSLIYNLVWIDLTQNDI